MNEEKFEMDVNKGKINEQLTTIHFATSIIFD